ncbi:MAG TPA: hypothetical protein K8V85_09550 [Staphylococcus kloosii]|uniref:Uncharacterized protein n=1 Tax=Staphylococcus kloosii TaxID=29384 RepID=A0A921KWE0_9STAP|nr:hypothetical protein [Staphylococcus kloosii]HJF68541.1 hypothetical protein [Staphylococcus kloosii]
MENPIKRFFGTNKNEVEVIDAIAQKSNTSVEQVKSILNASQQIIEMNNKEILQKQEDTTNMLIRHERMMNDLKASQNQINNRQKITNQHLKELRKLIDDKARKALGNQEQLDLDGLMFGNLTTSELFREQQVKAQNTKEYNKQLRKYKNKIWRIVKDHLNDVYNTPLQIKVEFFNDYMFDDIYNRISSLNVHEIRR